MEEELLGAEEAATEKVSFVARLLRILQMCFLILLAGIAGVSSYLLLDFAKEVYQPARVGASAPSALMETGNSGSGALTAGNETALAGQESGFYLMGTGTEEKTTQEIARLKSQVVRVETESGQGSGVLIHQNGYVITNWHVVEGDQPVHIFFEDRPQEGISVVIEKTDPEKDLALLRIEQLPEGIQLQPIPLGEFSRLEIGEKVVAIGSPRGLMNTVSEGIVSAIRAEGDLRYIQITAALSPGSSGGALLNDRGQLIGINTFKFIESENLNFAISSADIRNFLDQ